MPKSLIGPPPALLLGASYLWNFSKVWGRLLAVALFALAAGIGATGAVRFLLLTVGARGSAKPA